MWSDCWEDGVENQFFQAFHYYYYWVIEFWGAGFLGDWYDGRCLAGNSDGYENDKVNCAHLKIMPPQYSWTLLKVLVMGSHQPWEADALPTESNSCYRFIEEKLNNRLHIEIPIVKTVHSCAFILKATLFWSRAFCKAGIVVAHSARLQLDALHLPPGFCTSPGLKRYKHGKQKKIIQDLSSGRDNKNTKNHQLQDKIIWNG